MPRARGAWGKRFASPADGPDAGAKRSGKGDGMASLWSSFRLGGTVLPSRVVRTAVAESFCTAGGLPLPALRDHYALLGREGAVGLMIMGFVAVAASGRRRDGQILLDSDKAVRPLRLVTEAARRDGSRIFAQLSHAGIVAERAVIRDCLRGPSPLPEELVSGGPLAEAGEAMTEEETCLVTEAFIRAAKRARLAGFDGVQLHAAHGFLLNQFLSPLFNRRQDAWGGDDARRTRIVIDIVRGIRKACGEDFPIIAKVNASDMLEGGLTPEQSAEQVALMVEAGLDGVEVSGGNCVFSPVERTPFQKPDAGVNGGLFFAEAAAVIRSRVDVPVIVMGGIRTPEQAEEVVRSDERALAGLCRPLLRDPLLALKWKHGAREGSDCVSCNGCLRASRERHGVRCVLPL